MTRVLVTNDDGVHSAGIRLLAIAARHAGFTVVVAAPSTEASGSSASIMLAEQDGRVRIDERRLRGLDDVPAFSVAAPPALIALVATRGAFGDPPDLVLSGINRGANTGHAILHSGTVGAALTAAANGRSAMAVSLDVGVSPADPPRWHTAANVARDILPALREVATPTVLNVNIPDVESDQVRGVREATLASFGAVQTNIEVGDGYVRMTVADSAARLEPDTDAALLAGGYATVTALRAICEAAPARYDWPSPGPATAVTRAPYR